MSEKPLLAVSGLTKHFKPSAFSRGPVVRAIEDVSFEVPRGKVVGLVGESGSGKTTIGRSVLRLVEPTSGTVRFDGVDMTSLPPQELRRQRARMQYIFQDPFASLSPRMTIGQILMEGLEIQGMRPREARVARAKSALAAVELPADAFERYAHEFSGGQRQRIGIARALALNPKFIVCDEPIAALDVSIQAQVVNLLEELQGRLNLTYLFISHDLSMVRHIADRVAVMYLGKVVELAPREGLYDAPKHPYTVALLSAVPEPDPAAHDTANRVILQGDVPSPSNPPKGCNFCTRCPRVMDICKQADPEFREIEPGRFVACHLYNQ